MIHFKTLMYYDCATYKMVKGSANHTEFLYNQISEFLLFDMWIQNTVNKLCLIYLLSRKCIIIISVILSLWNNWN